MDPISEIIRYGKILQNFNYVHSTHSGNISVRLANKIYIKKHGKMLGYLKRNDIIELDMDDEKNYDKASVEVYVHREIYRKSDKNAIIHAHTPYAIIVSLFYDKIYPVDDEGKYYLSYIPVVEAEKTIASMEVGEKLSIILKEIPVAIVKGHGTFSAGKDLDEALKYLSLAESISHLKYLYDTYSKIL